MHEVGLDVVEQSLIVGDDYGGVLRRAQLVDARGHHAQSVDVEPRIGLVEDAQARLQHRHLKYLVAFLLAAGKAFVDRARGELVVKLHYGAFLTHQFEEVAGRQGRLVEILPLGVDRRTHEVDHRHPGDLHRILEREKQPLVTAVLGRQRQEVEAVKLGAPLGDCKGRIAGQHARQRRFSRPVGAHDGVHLAGMYLKIDAAEDLLVLHLGVKIFDLQQYIVVHNAKLFSILFQPTDPSRLSCSSF